VKFEAEPGSSTRFEQRMFTVATLVS
jgi:hypothetical protein